MSASERCARIISSIAKKSNGACAPSGKGERLGYAPDAVVLHAQGTATGGGGALKTRSKTAIYLSERNRILLTRDVFPGHLAIAAPLSLLHLADKIRQGGRLAAGRIRDLRLAGRTSR